MPKPRSREAAIVIHDIDTDFIPPDRYFGKIERLVLFAEREQRSNPHLCGIVTVDDVVICALRYTDEPGEGFRDRRAYRIRQAIGTIAEREHNDLTIADDTYTNPDGKTGVEHDCVIRTERYMVPREGLQPAPGRKGNRNPLTPRSGYLTDRIKDAPAIVAEELARIADGFAPPSYDPVELHLVLSIFGPKLLSAVRASVATALAASSPGHDLV